MSKELKVDSNDLNEEDTHKVWDHCIRCGRALKAIRSQRLGYGPVCYKKHHLGPDLMPSGGFIQKFPEAMH